MILGAPAAAKWRKSLMPLSQRLSLFFSLQYHLIHVDRHEFMEIMDMLDKRLNDSGKNWRHVFKVDFDQ